MVMSDRLVNAAEADVQLMRRRVRTAEQRLADARKGLVGAEAWLIECEQVRDTERRSVA